MRYRNHYKTTQGHQKRGLMLRAAFLGSLLSTAPESTVMVRQRETRGMLHPSARVYEQVKMAADELDGSQAKRLRIDAVEHLRALPTIRDRCNQIYEVGKAGALRHFTIYDEHMPKVVDFVLEVINDRFPAGFATVPFHSRFRHFEPGGVERLSKLRTRFEGVDKVEVARRLVDLVVVSVLLDAGAGDAWKYTEEGTGIVLSRSEGLGVASFHMFEAGAFSSDASNKFQADSAGLKALTTEAIRTGFQVDAATNPLVGAEGRAELLRSLGSALELHPEYFTSPLSSGVEGTRVCRFGHVVDYLLARANDKHEVSVHELWVVIMNGLESIWPSGPGRTSVCGRSMGDVWPHSALPKTPEDASSGLVPFHKLSQWLCYSLLEPLSEAGLVVSDTEAMTGLPEYRNGGLFVDFGVLLPKYDEVLTSDHKPDAEVIIEWRALTVCLLDEVAKLVRERLTASTVDLPLVKILEGGTWTAGRRIAKDRRPDTAGPPIVIISDGTVF